MGRQISYFRNNFNVGFKDLLLENYSAFRQWYLDTDAYGMEEYNEPFGDEELKQYFLQHRELSPDFSIADKRIVDRLTSDFIGYYCDMTDREGEILEFFGPSLGTWRYQGSSEMVLQTGDPEFIQLWSFIIIHGRSLKDYNKFEGFTDDFKIGFLTHNECRTLRAKIETYFGSREEMQRKYWTAIEKKQLQDAMSRSGDGSYYLSGHNPVSAGLEYVLEVLVDVAGRKNELITVIE